MLKEYSWLTKTVKEIGDIIDGEFNLLGMSKSCCFVANLNGKTCRRSTPPGSNSCCAEKSCHATEFRVACKSKYKNATTFLYVVYLESSTDREIMIKAYHVTKKVAKSERFNLLDFVVIHTTDLRLYVEIILEPLEEKNDKTPRSNKHAVDAV